MIQDPRLSNRRTFFLQLGNASVSPYNFLYLMHGRRVLKFGSNAIAMKHTGSGKGPDFFALIAEHYDGAGSPYFCRASMTERSQTAEAGHLGGKPMEHMANSLNSSRAQATTCDGG
jgi:hypothetical protein